MPIKAPIKTKGFSLIIPIKQRETQNGVFIGIQ